MGKWNLIGVERLPKIRHPNRLTRTQKKASLVSGKMDSFC